MTSRSRRFRTLVTAILVTLALALLAACGDDDDGGEATPTPDPSASGDATAAPSASPTPGSIEALGAYLEDEGMDGQTGALTDPIDCADITDDTDGEFCIRNEVSIYGPGRVVVYVADVEDTNEKVWSVRVTLVDNEWQVTQAESIAPEE